MSASDERISIGSHSNDGGGGRFASASRRQVELLADGIGRERLVVPFLAYTGLRYGEMAALRLSNFDMLRRRVDVRQSVTEVKGKLVWSSSDDLAALMAGKTRDDLMFTAPEGGVLRLATFRTRTFNKAVEALRPVDDDGNVIGNFPRATIHDLRHTAASLVNQCRRQRQGCPDDARTPVGCPHARHVRGPFPRRSRT